MKRPKAAATITQLPRQGPLGDAVGVRALASALGQTGRLLNGPLSERVLKRLYQ